MTRVFRNHRLTYIAWMLVVGSPMLFIWGGAVAPGSLLPNLAISSGFGVISALFFSRIARLRVEVDEAGVRVYNFIATRHLNWDEIKAFYLPTGADWAVAELHSGARVALQAIQPARITWILGRRSHAADVVDELNLLRSQRP